MSGIPFLSLADIVIDEQVARKLPRHLAYYHRALPIAEGDEAITIVMAHPESRAVVDVLAAVLKAEVVPVRGDEKEIQAALDRLFPEEEVSDPFRVLASSALGESLASQIAARLGALLTLCKQSDIQSWGELIQTANSAQFDLAIIHTRSIIDAGELLRQLSTSLLILSQTAPTMDVRSMLCILRGHTPDEIMLDWAERFALVGITSITLLAIAGSGSFHTRGISALLNTHHAAGEHVKNCVQTLSTHGHRGKLKLRQGDPLEQIAQEVIEGDYDLVAVPAEAFGDFVQQMLIALAKSRMPNASALPSVLIVRPM